MKREGDLSDSEDGKVALTCGGDEAFSARTAVDLSVT
jgi:hypothetical protein